MDRSSITARIQTLEFQRRLLLDRAKTSSGQSSRSKYAAKHQAKAEYLAEQIKALTIRDDISQSCAYDIPATALGGKTWRSTSFPEVPAIGTAVTCTINHIGPGIVAGYFFEHGFAGVIVQLSDAPAWHREQNKGKWHEGHALVFGSEIKVVE